jgi:hypothetical protein
MTAYTVRVDFYSLEQGHVGQLTGESISFSHRTLKAAFRRLGSLISGKQHKLTLRQMRGAHLYILTPQHQRFTWVDARYVIEAEKASAKALADFNSVCSREHY